MKRKNELQPEFNEYAFWLIRVLNARLVKEYGSEYSQDLLLWVEAVDITITEPI